jgi:predicted ATP-dependent endonuclease of OLD family
MKLSRIKIEGLFGQFDYDIKLNQDEGITILTGPNGYGKTTILKIIWSLFNQDFYFTQSLPFKEISFGFDNCHVICLTRKIVHSTLTTRDGAIVVTRDKEELTFKTEILCFTLTDKGGVRGVFELSGEKMGEEQAPVLKFFESIKVYAIKDQRLTYVTTAKRDETFKRDGTIKSNAVAVLNTIELFSRNLAEHISHIKSEEDKLAVSLADSFPGRLLKYNQPLPNDVFEKRFETLSQKQQKLQKYGIMPGTFTKSEYEGENQRVLSVYLEDYEQKTSLYDELIAKIELFVSIMDSKCLTNKTFTINAAQGFRFISINGKRLALGDLSSGEQNEIILLYELLFNAPPDSLVLIDEPETSMHVAWQIEFLHDIEKIAKLSKLSFIIATHAPDLINDKMDLCVDLFENTRINGNDEK